MITVTGNYTYPEHTPMWTTHERQSAQARALEEKGAEYILPIQVEQIELPGLRPTIIWGSRR